MTASRETRGKARMDDHLIQKEEEQHEYKKQKVDRKPKATKGSGKTELAEKQEVEDEGDQQMADGAVNDESASEEFEQFVEQLKEECSSEDIKLICEENGLNCELPNTNMLFDVADQMFYGPLESCPLCDGKLMFNFHQYKCSGYISEWSMCNYTTRDANRTKGSLKIPKKLKNDFLKQFEKSHDASKRPTRALASADIPFAGMTLVLSGRLSKTHNVLKADIEKYGGKIANGVSEGVTCLIAGPHEVDGGGSSKTAEAIEKNIPIVKEQWITDCIEKKTCLPLEAYDMAAELPGDHDVPWDKKLPEQEAAVSLMAELKLVGKRGVYKDTQLAEEGGKIYEKDGIIYNCAFSVCDITAGLNHYAILELVEMPKGAIYLYYKRGRVGDRLHNTERLDEMDNPKAAVKEFVKMFQQLTGNEFEPWEREKKIEKKRNKFYPIDMAGGVDARAGGFGVRQLGVAASHTKIDPRVAQDLKVLMSQEIYRYAMVEMGIDAPDLPSGNLTEYHLQLCGDILQQFAKYLKKPEKDTMKHERMCLDFSNKWWSLLHTTRPFIMTDLMQLADTAAPTLDSLRAISLASQIIGDLTGATLDDPLADRYLKLGCEITPLDHEGEDFKMIHNYLTKTFEPVKFMDGAFGVVMEEACMIQSSNTPTLSDLEKISNKMLLWCGTRTSNLLACMHMGMPPAAIQASAPGYMFGQGLYCSDAAASAAMYGFTAVDRPEGYLILAVVAMGDEVLELTEPKEDVSEYKKRKVAIKGLGKKTTDEKSYMKYKNDITVPCGSLISSGHDDSLLEFNEFCVYDPQQVAPHFLVRVRYEAVDQAEPVTGRDL